MTDKKPPGGVVCHYCHNPGHVRRDYRKLQNKNRRFQCAHEPLKDVYTPSTMLVGSSKPNTCLISSSSNRFIDSGATDHMTDNSSLFTMFQPHLSTSTVTLADGLTSCVLGSETIHLTPSITLISIMSLPQFSFNLIYMSKLTCTLNCSISFFQDLSMKQVIGRGRESRLFVLELLSHLNFIVAWGILLSLC